MASLTIFHDCQPVPTFANHHNFNTNCIINMQSCIHIYSDSLLWFCFQLLGAKPYTYTSLSQLKMYAH